MQIEQSDFEERWDWAFGNKDFKTIDYSSDGIPGENEIVFHSNGEEVMRFTQDGKFFCMGEELQTAGEVYEVLRNWASYLRVD